MDEGLRNEPESVREAIEDYRKGSNPFAQWMDARVIRDETAGCGRASSTPTTRPGARTTATTSR
jgi:hypothetical protein